MPTKIILKNSTVKDKAPQPADLDVGELAVNLNKDSPAIYGKDSAGAIVKLAGEGSIGDDWTRDDGTATVSPRTTGDNVSTTGTVTGASLIPTGATVPTDGVYLPAANTVGIATGGVERMRIRSDGNIGIGGAGSAVATLYNQKAVKGGATAGASLIVSNVQSDVTTLAYGYRCQLSTVAEAFTLGSLIYYDTNRASFGAGSSVTNQFGFYARSNLTGATHNYGFYGNLVSAAGRWNFYAATSAPNYFAGDVRSGTVVTQAQVPTNSQVSTTMTASSLLNGIRIGTPLVANIDYTLPTAANMEAAFQELQGNQSFQWSVINNAVATNTITVVANTGHAVEGNMVVQPDSSGRFLTRKISGTSFTTYRIA